MLLKCTNHYYVSESDKKALIDYNPLERNHLRYLLMRDPEIQPLLKQRGYTVKMHVLLYAFGLFQHTIDQIKEMQEDMDIVLNGRKEGILVLFLGVVNHWVTIVIHKEQKDKPP